MREGGVFYKNELAGKIRQLDNGSFVFRYEDGWFLNTDKPAISLTLPKKKQEYHSEFLFPFFYNMLPEGRNKQVVCFNLRIDPNDYFGLLLSVANNDTIGAVKVKRES
ncbi:HipA N-terminal domain-containing protein [Formosa sp. A9]|uniref:HipA N-terminal domain-containing protein n=1 Tax=Formosa sp. A9 TaxID=3442641 RepID=UPI003EB7ECE8